MANHTRLLVENNNETTDAPTISVCICTMDRPEILRRCLASIREAEQLPFEVVVSDDSKTPENAAGVCSEFDFVRYTTGPRTGLCANRNHAIGTCRGNFISLLDDDAVIAPDFIRLASELLPDLPPDTIITGNLKEDGIDLVTPANPSFWGFFQAKPVGRFETIHLNSNLFPRAAFDSAQFDEKIVYGYEDMDLCACLLNEGYRIQHFPQLVNLHLPPTRDVAGRPGQKEQARFYTSLKRYLVWQRRPFKACAYLILAPLHQSLHYVKAGQWRAAIHTVRNMQIALHTLKQR